ncbi:hypothetical protein ASG78_01290 [Nostocoides sp. Soil756]|jgi:hypothetical protein|nr:hypothetical protein ASG78_01290 [Tetrasphaera sp. Soil756]
MAWLTLLLAAMVATAQPATAPAAAAAALAVPAVTTAAAPSPPVLTTARGFVDGIRVSWSRGTVDATRPAPTSYLLTRTGPVSGAVTVPVLASGSSSDGYEDTTAPAGEALTYSVVALRAGAASDPGAPSPEVMRPAWDGPYAGARTALVMVWDQASASTGSDSGLDSVLADGAQVTWEPGWSSFGTDATHRFLAPDVPDGRYDVGTSPGQVDVTAVAGAPCAAPTGVVTLSRTAYALAGLAAQTADAELDCANGHHLRVAFRWATPDPLPLVRTAVTAVTTVTAGGEGSVSATVRNDGSEGLELSAVRLVPLDDDTSGALSVTASTCPGTALAPGASCVVTVAARPAADASRESRAIVAVDTPWGEHEAGIVVGQLAGHGQDAPTLVSSPRGVRMTWAAPASVLGGFAAYRVERQAAAGPVVLKRRTLVAEPWTEDLGPLPTGAATYRVVLETLDGRELPSPWSTVHVPAGWLLLATTSGVVAVNPDDGWAAGGTFGRATLSAPWPVTGLSADPRRSAVLAAVKGDSYGFLTDLGPSTQGVGSAVLAVPDTQPEVSPDGRRAVVVRTPVVTDGRTTQVGGLVVIARGTGAESPVPASDGLLSPAWLPDGSALLAVTPDSRIVRVDLTTGARTTVLTDTHVSDLAVSNQGRMAFVRSTGFYDQSIVEASLTGTDRRTVASYTYPSGLRYDPTGRYLFAGGHEWTEGAASRVYDLAPTTPTLVARLPLASDAAWWDPVSSAPAVTVSVAEWTGTQARVVLGASDADDAPGGLATQCRIDTGVWVACGPSWTTPALAAGRHTVTVTVTDPSGAGSTATRSWSVDTTAPVASLGTVPTATLGTTLTTGWVAGDAGGSGLRSYDLRYRRASIGSRLGAYVYPRTLQGTPGRTARLTVSQGYEYCLSVRARDVAGNVGAWSAERCTSVVLDDRSLTAGTGWTRGVSSSYVFGTFTRTTRSGVSLTRPGVSTRRLGIVATTCATCGAVDVYVGSTRLGRISLTSSAARTRQVRWLPLMSSTRAGTVTLRSTSTRTTVIDGLLVWH